MGTRTIDYEELKRIREAERDSLKRLGADREIKSPPLDRPKAPNELGPPGSSLRTGTAGMGGYQLAKRKRKRRPLEGLA